MTQRETVTVAVLFMKPVFVTIPKNDMGGIFESKPGDGLKVLPFWGCLSLLRIQLVCAPGPFIAGGRSSATLAPGETRWATYLDP